MDLSNSIARLHGPILIIGASGFIGANLLRACLAVRDDVVGTIFSGNSWRLQGIATANLSFLNLEDPYSVRMILTKVEPKTIFDCSSFGAYSFEQDSERIHATNYLSFIRLMEQLTEFELSAYVHAGSSSEYGLNAHAPDESAALVPNSHYAVSKAASSHAITYFGKIRKVPVANLRLYSVYGPYEDSSRLIPVLCERAQHGQLPRLANPDVTRDFVHIDDVCSAFISCALAMGPDIAGESFNIGSGRPTRLDELACIAQHALKIDANPEFDSNVGRAWDVNGWYANPTKAQQKLGWKVQIQLEDGLLKTFSWWTNFLKNTDFKSLTKQGQTAHGRKSVSAIVACYRDEQAIPIMHNRLVSVFQKIGIDYEIIFINDNSPDNSAEVIREISARDPFVIGVNHSRNFGSQAAFRSGMELASKEACVLLDGDLQDPPELIETFVEQWRNGADVVYGRRIKREMPRWLEVFYHGFYGLLAAMSEVKIPKDAGDFSLIDRSVVYWILQCQERDSFIRGLRAYVGFKQVGVDYIRPERMFGVSTNNWIKNIGWAKKAIFSFSRLPLHLLTAFGGIAFIGSVCISAYSIVLRIVHPESVPPGLTFVSLLVMFFGSSSILGIGLLGEYIGKILEESKARPPFIRRSLTMRGEFRSAQHRMGQ